MEIRHFILTNDGAIREFSVEDALRIANGAAPVPELAESAVRYLQVLVDTSDEDITVRTAGTLVKFDKSGLFCGTAGEEDVPEALNGITPFEHDACVEFALQGDLPGRLTYH